MRCNSLVREAICVLLAWAVFITGCAGREANPVTTYVQGDENLSCGAISEEIKQIKAKMEELKPKTNKFGTNALWAVAGVFLIVPFFFMDFKDAEKIEYDAYHHRQDRLIVIAKDKGCETVTAEKTAKTASAEGQ